MKLMTMGRMAAAGILFLLAGVADAKPKVVVTYPYIAALVNLGLEPVPTAVGVVVVLLCAAVVGRIVVRGASRTDRRLTIPVAAYITAISVMVAAAIGTTIPFAIAGALLFYLSDACIGWSRFVGEFTQSRMAIITTYHLGQVGLVLGLVAL